MPLIPERLTVWECGEHRLEAWITPEVKPGWHLYVYKCGVLTGRHGASSEVQLRKQFEKRAEELCK